MHFRLPGVIFAMREGGLIRKRGCAMKCHACVCVYVCTSVCSCVDLRQKKECGSERRGCGVEYVFMHIFVCMCVGINLQRTRSVGVDEKVGCNNGGGGRNFSKVKRLVAKSIGTQKRLFCGFFVALVGFQKRRSFFPRYILRINPCMHICPLSWALRICKNIVIRTYFGSVTVEFVKVFRTLHFGAT